MSDQKLILVYIRGIERGELVRWAESKLGPLEVKYDEDGALIFHSTRGTEHGWMNAEIGIADGPYVLVTLGGDAMPWATDRDCALEAARKLDRNIVFDPGTPNPFVWNLVTPDGTVTEMSWVDEPEPVPRGAIR